MLLDILQWPHDANLTTSCLLWILQHHTTNGRLSDTLYIQLDNCARENKVRNIESLIFMSELFILVFLFLHDKFFFQNKYFLGLMAYLVKMGYTKEIYLSFLMVVGFFGDFYCMFYLLRSLKKKKCLFYILCRDTPMRTLMLVLAGYRSNSNTNLQRHCQTSLAL